MKTPPDILPKSFYKKKASEVAPKLLGKILHRKFGNYTLAGIITEVEAYEGDNDEASHACGGMKNKNRPMFSSGGIFYVYFTYGNHHCCNVVTGKKDEGQAVLIRALQPISGIEIMARHRYHRTCKDQKEVINLTNGPGKLCQACAITRKENEEDLAGDIIWITKGKKIPAKDIAVSKRIGISKAKNIPWRFYIKDNPFVSRKS